jgi:hypothetical protein
LTKIRKIVKRQYYLKTEYKNAETGEPKTKYKRTYEQTVYLVQFPKHINVIDLLGKELTFEKKGETIIIKPKRS